MIKMNQNLDQNQNQNQNLNQNEKFQKMKVLIRKMNKIKMQKRFV